MIMRDNKYTHRTRVRYLCAVFLSTMTLLCSEHAHDQQHEVHHYAAHEQGLQVTAVIDGAQRAPQFKLPISEAGLTQEPVGFIVSYRVKDFHAQRMVREKALGQQDSINALDVVQQAGINADEESRALVMGRFVYLSPRVGDSSRAGDIVTITGPWNQAIADKKWWSTFSILSGCAGMIAGGVATALAENLSIPTVVSAGGGIAFFAIGAINAWHLSTEAHVLKRDQQYVWKYQKNSKQAPIAFVIDSVSALSKEESPFDNSYKGLYINADDREKYKALGKLRKVILASPSVSLHEAHRNKQDDDAVKFMTQSLNFYASCVTPEQKAALMDAVQKHLQEKYGEQDVTFQPAFRST